MNIVSVSRCNVGSDDFFYAVTFLFFDEGEAVQIHGLMVCPAVHAGILRQARPREPPVIISGGTGERHHPTEA